MAKKNVLIVARTKMYGAKICVGALSDQGEYLRLMNRSCESDQAGRVQYRIGQRWEVDCEPCGQQRPPHVEDVSVTSARQIGTQQDLSAYLLNNTTPWEGTMDVLFDRKIHFTMNGGGYISSADIPDRATGFWVPSEPLRLATSVKDDVITDVLAKPVMDHGHELDRVQTSNGSMPSYAQLLKVGSRAAQVTGASAQGQAPAALLASDNNSESN